MDTNTYEQIEIQKSNLTWELNFLKPNDNVNISSYENEILGLILPDKVTLQIIETEPAIKGDTATNALKNATVETGLQVRVPMFIEQDEYIIVNTSDGKYHSRA
jgi:elongation factor P